MVCKSSLFLTLLLHKNIKGKMRIYVTTFFLFQAMSKLISNEWQHFMNERGQSGKMSAELVFVVGATNR
jgi:hypothetical protein